MAEFDGGDCRARKRPLEIIEFVDDHHKLTSLEENHTASTVLDEIELHFQRSLFKDKSKWKIREQKSPEELESSPDSMSQNHSTTDVREMHDDISERHTRNLVPEKCSASLDPAKEDISEDIELSEDPSEKSPSSSKNKVLSSSLSRPEYECKTKQFDRDDELSSEVSVSISHHGYVSNGVQNNKVTDLIKHSPSGTVHHNNHLSLKRISQLPKTINPRGESSSANEAIITGRPKIFTRNYALNIQGTPVSPGLILLPASHSTVGTTVMMPPQPYILVNSSEMQAYLGRNCNGDVTETVPNIPSNSGSGGYILLSSNPVSNSLIQISAGVAGTSTVNSAIIPTTKAVEAPTKPCFLGSDDINIMPASVEDHFAKALGDKWSNHQC